MIHFLDLARIDIVALQSRDPAAWRAFLAQCDPLLHAIAAWPKWRFDAHTREDVVQATRASLAQSLPNLTCDAALPAFVRRVCVNRCIDALRRRLRDQEHLVPLVRWDSSEEAGQQYDAPADESYDPVREIILSERAAALRRALPRLDPVCQDAVRAFYVDGKSYKELADSQGITVNTVGSRLSRCLDKLRALLGEQET
ncbi:MAG: RNA polymerase sigma factor [Kiritimatiellia bacterium]